MLVTDVTQGREHLSFLGGIAVSDALRPVCPQKQQPVNHAGNGEQENVTALPSERAKSKVPRCIFQRYVEHYSGILKRHKKLSDTLEASDSFLNQHD